MSELQIPLNFPGSFVTEGIILEYSNDFPFSMNLMCCRSIKIVPYILVKISYSAN